jgi:hypothetical protein
MISDSKDGQATSKTGVAVAGISVGRSVAVNVRVGEGIGVGVSGMMSRVAARQAKVEKRSARVHKIKVLTERVCMQCVSFFQSV